MTNASTPAAPPAATPDGKDLWAEYQRREAEARAADHADLATLRPQLLALARAAGATTITAHYEGGHDSGLIDQIHADPPEADDRLKEVVIQRPEQRWNPATRAYETVARDTPFFQAVEQMCSMLLVAKVGNWWDGPIEASGEIVWHVGDEPDRITGEHTLTTQSSEYEEWEDPAPDDGGFDPHPVIGA